MNSSLIHRNCLNKFTTLPYFALFQITKYDSVNTFRSVKNLIIYKSVYKNIIFERHPMLSLSNITEQSVAHSQ